MTDYTADLALFIDGAWQSGEGRDASPVVDPATGDAIGQVPHASAADLDSALAAADAAFKPWAATDVETRSGILRRAAALLRDRAETIATTLTL